MWRDQVVGCGKGQMAYKKTACHGIFPNSGLAICTLLYPPAASRLTAMQYIEITLPILREHLEKAKQIEMAK